MNHFRHPCIRVERHFVEKLIVIKILIKLIADNRKNNVHNKAETGAKGCQLYVQFCKQKVENVSLF